MNRGANLGWPFALIIIGAVLYFGLSAATFGPANLKMIGMIAAGVGLVWLVIELVQGNRKRVAVTQERVVPRGEDGASVREIVTEDK